MKKEKGNKSTWIVEDTEQRPSEDNQVKKKRKKEKLLQNETSSTDPEQKPKPKKKRNKGKKAKNIPTAVKNEDGNKDKCLSYLKKWHEDRQNWKFEKLRQIWLLQNMFEAEKIPDSDFDVLVNYISSIRGQAKQTVTEKAMKVIKTREKWTELTQQGLEEEEIATQVPDGNVTEEIYERARSILQSIEDV
ncbi:protein cholesin [Periplaneta americana]|uniref:protein cholesin n=1 Tax=Periplaneta americana TaxID=6978 RepID=UPI0037E95499